MSYPDDRFKNILEKLRFLNYRITPQRLAIIKILAASIGHPSVEQIFAQVKADFPTTSLATVYKNVSMLKTVGEVLELGFSDGGSRYDGNKPYPHPHLMCTECKNILDPDLASLQDMTNELAAETGFRIVSHRLDFFGVCPQCQKGE